MQLRYVELKNHGLYVINFEYLFYDAYKNIVQDLYTYDKFNDFNVRSQDTKKIYYYHLIKQICDVVSSCKTDDRVVVYYCDKDIKCDFKQCDNKRTRKGVKRDNRPEFLLFMNRFLKQIKNILPVKLFVGDVKFNTFVQYYNTNKGKYVETINSIKNTRVKPINMEKFKKFTDKYKLNYLTKHYTDNLKIKGMAYK